MFTALREARHPLELSLLLALAVFLPLFEAPKNLAWLAYVCAWLANRARATGSGAPASRPGSATRGSGSA